MKHSRFTDEQIIGILNRPGFTGECFIQILGYLSVVE